MVRGPCRFPFFGARASSCPVVGATETVSKNRTYPAAAESAPSRCAHTVLRPATWIPTVLGALAVALLSALLLRVAARRLIDGDEGYLLMAARLISEGLLPYRDFFLPQGPIVPAVFAGYFLVLGRSWLGARMLAGVIAALSCYLVYRETLSITRRSAAAILAAALFGLSAGTLGWLTIVKGYGLSALLVLLSIVAARRANETAWTRRGQRMVAVMALMAGLASGLATSTRLYLLLVAPMLCLHLMRRQGLTRRGFRSLAWFSSGFVLGMLPLAFGYLMAGKAFVFDTIQFHAVREYGQSSAFGTFAGKWNVVRKALGFHAKSTMAERQLMGLQIGAALSGLTRWIAPGRRGSAATYVWPAILVGSLLPNPFHPQYLCLLVPFLAIEVGLLLGTLLDACARRANRPLALVVLVVGTTYAAYHGGVGAIERRRFTEHGTNVPGIWSSKRAPNWSIAVVEAMAQAIDAHEAREAASWWPGYMVTSETPVARPLANDFGLRAAEVLTPDERRRYHVVNHAEIGDMIRRHRPRIFVEGNWAARPWADLLPMNGYRVRAEIANARLWTAP
jgi:hypothetical protein